MSKSSDDDAVEVKVADFSSPAEAKRRRLRITLTDLHLFVLQNAQFGFARPSQCSVVLLLLLQASKVP